MSHSREAVRDYRRPAMLTALVGNATEWYDFSIYGGLASVLAVVMLPPGHTSAGLVGVFAVFATSFLARPVGALLVGVRADRVGRRRLLAGMILMMAASTAAIGLLPPWSAIGVAAPVCLVLLRLAQGFSSGGEISTSIAFLLESAPVRRWGWYGGWHIATVAIGIACGLGAAAVTSAVLSAGDLESWGWRIPFLVALPLGLVGLYIRIRIDEAPDFAAAALGADEAGPGAAKLRAVWRGHAATVGTGFVLVGVLAGTFNMWLVFLPAHLVVEDLHPLPVALGCAVGGLAAVVVAAPMLGALSDRVGRRPLLLGASAALCLLALPVYALATLGSPFALLLADVLIGLVLGALVVTAHVAERFPVSLRASGIALTYGLATALIGGSAPFVGSVLAREGLDLGIPLYLVILGVAGIVATLRAPAALPAGWGTRNG